MNLLNKLRFDYANRALVNCYNCGPHILYIIYYHGLDCPSTGAKSPLHLPIARLSKPRSIPITVNSSYYPIAGNC